MRVGILGGSFNPPHVGHLALARAVLDLDLVDRVCLIPAGAPPHKDLPREADAATRLAMARLLAEEDSRLEADGLELERSGRSYSIDTVRALYSRHPHNRYRLIIGSDMAKTFASWREFRVLLRLAPPLTAERPDSVFSDGGGCSDFPGMTREECGAMRAGRFAMTPVEVSSTRVRALLAAGAEDGEMLRFLTASVLRFIREAGLYGAGK